MIQIRKLKCPPGCAQLTFLAHTKSGGSRNQGLTALVVSAEAFVLTCKVFLQFCLFFVENYEMPADAEKGKKRLCVFLLVVGQDFGIQSICRKTCLKAEGEFRKSEWL